MKRVIYETFSYPQMPQNYSGIISRSKLTTLTRAFYLIGTTPGSILTAIMEFKVVRGI